MIRKFTLLLLAVFGIISVSAGNTYIIKGETYSVDTLFHAQVGPGTTQTSLLFKGPAYNLRAFYLTVDLKHPNVSIRTVCATDKVAGNQLTSEMAKSHSAPGKQYYAGVNGDFFATTGKSTNGKSIVGTPTSACIVDGEFYKTTFSSQQFAIDELGLPFVGRANFRTGTATKGTDKVPFLGVNENSPNNGITIYTHRYYGSTNQQDKANACAEVTAIMVEGEALMPGKSCKMEVTGVATSTGDLAIPDNGYVIHGRGTSTANATMGSRAFVESLKVGDIVTIDAKVLIGDETIVPTQMISGNPRTIGNGETLDTEGERGDASAYHPRTGIGYGDSKSKVIMMVVDGRSGLTSNGVRTSQLGDIMRYAGATDAINLDGGGSSTLYTSALGIRNRPSDGTERADGNAIFAVSDAPEDNVITEIKFVDWAMEFPKHGTYSPKFYGYNQYGMLVDVDLKGVVLSCSAELGYIDNKSTFVGNGTGTSALSATYNECKASIPVTIVEATDMSMRHKQVLNDTFREYSVEVEATMNEQKMPLSPAALSWSSDDASICEINAQNGIIAGKANGETVVRGVLDSFTGETTIIVEKPTDRVMPADPNMDITTWKVSQAGGKNIVASTLENGIKLVYTGDSEGRAPNIKLAKKLRLWSLPDTVRVRINPGSAPINKVILSIIPSKGSSINTTIENIKANEINIIDLPLDNLFDTKDMIYYPILLNYIQFGLDTSTTGTEYTIEIPGIETVYKAVSTSGIENVLVNKTASICPNPVIAGSNAILKTTCNGNVTVSICNIAGQIIKALNADVTNNTIELPVSEFSAGSYIVTVLGNGIKSNAKLRIQ